MLIPHEFLIHRSYIFVPVNERNIKWIADKTDIPKCPVFVFVDLKMEFFAVRLLEEFRYQLNQDPVVAVLDQSFINRQKIKTEEPEKALKEFYGILENLKCKGHKFADEIQKKMTIMIVGGDVFANWFMGVICDLKLPGSPSIVPIALGIKANIASSFGWVRDLSLICVLIKLLKHLNLSNFHMYHICVLLNSRSLMLIKYR
ncbi:putative diacylglycerol kinase (ATP) [Rosa chinensis]|uniref:Putative diacylglycerol kinase (ATP) n=1 Tax=Rosa chinensis TaxID=74649 RepID=A0A2P6S095_ROSCH|nr:putative diacylglycerol kinase (ATP) [Rosa chinensis]